MNFTQHVSGEALEDFLEGGLPGCAKEAVRLHLSYCPICRGQRDTLSLMRAVERMRDDYERTDHPAREHVSDKVFERFWRGEVRGAEYLERISGHCIACRRCQQRRHDIMLRLGVESTRRRGQVVAVGLVLWTRAWQRRRGLIIAALLLIGGASLFRGTRQRFFTPGGGRPATPAQVATPNGPEPLTTARNSDGNTNAAPPASTSATAEGADRTGPSPLLIAQSRGRNEPKPAAPPSQSVSLRERSGDDEIRGEGGGKQATYFKVSPSRVGPTRLRIELPEMSTGGVYGVSVQEPVGLRPLVQSKARSRDGKALTVSLDLKEIPEGEYLLCLVREGAEPGEEEYLGHYPLLLVKSGAPIVTRSRHTN